MANINSRQKGARGERELANFLTDAGWPARRGQQFKGSGDSPDVVCERLAKHDFQIECKRVERFSLYDALEQAQRDAGPFVDGVVFHRKNNKPWVAVMDAKAFLRVLEQLNGGQAHGTEK